MTAAEAVGPQARVLRVCAWCQELIGTRPAGTGERHGDVSHGMCDRCERQQLDAAEEPEPAGWLLLGLGLAGWAWAAVRSAIRGRGR